MAANWAPHSPGSIGLGFFPDTVQDIGPSAGRGLALTIDSTATETIASAYLGISSVSNAGYLLAEVYPIASVVPGAVTTSSFAPNGVLTGDGSTWENNVGTTTAAALADAVNNGVVNTASYDQYTGSLSAHTRLEFLYPTAGALWPANQRVVSGALVFAAALMDSTGQLQVWYNQAGTRVLMGTVTLTTDIQTYAVPLGEINPVTNLPWTRAEVQDFDGASGFGFRPLTGTAKPLRIYDVRLDLSWVTEDRVAVGTLAVNPTDTLAWATVPLQTPNGGAANWAKANATSYTVVVRPPTGPLSSPAQFTVRTLGQTGVTELPQGSIPYRPVLGTGGVVVAEGDPVVQAMALAFDINASATDSADGQPYMQGGTIGSGGQTVNGAAAGTYTVLRMAIGVPDAYTLDTPITWIVASPGPVTLATGTVTIAEVLASPLLLRLDDAFPLGGGVGPGSVYMVEVLTSVTLAAATTYTISVGGNIDIAVWPLSTRIPSGISTVERGNPATYGGVTLDFSSFDYEDWPVTLSTQPVTPTGFQASIVDRDVTPTGPAGSCGLSTLEEIRLQWNATSVGAAFAYYEIQRSSDQGATWDLVYRITDENVDQATDQEHPYNLETWYRLRSVRAGDLIPSVWSDTEQITANLPGCPLVFSSNLHPDLMLGFPHTDRITWQQPSSDEVAIVAPTGADYHTALIAEENRGDIINQTITVWSPGFSAPSDPPAPGRWMLDPVIALTRAPAPYTCVRDETGRVWYANVNITEGTRAEPNHSYTADAVITELTGTPAIIDLTATILGTAAAWWDWRDGSPSRSGDVPDRSGNGRDLTPVTGSYGLPVPFDPSVEDDPLILFPGFADEGISTPDPGVEGDYLEITWEDEPTGLTAGLNRSVAHQGDDTGNNAGWFAARDLTTGTPALVWSPDGTPGAVQFAVATAAPGVGVGRARIKARYADQGSGSAVTFYTQNLDDDPTLPWSDPSWDQLGAPTVLVAPAQVFQPGTPLTCSSADTIAGQALQYDGLLYRLIVTASTGQILADLDPTRALRPYDTLDGGAGETWTFYRALTTNSTRVDVIARACSVNGNNSHWSAGDILDVVAGSQTAVAALWEQSADAALNGVIGKSDIDFNPTDEPCWGVADSVTEGGFWSFVSDGTGAPGTGFANLSMDPQPGPGEIVSTGLVIDRATDDLYAYSQGTQAGPVDISGIGSMANTFPLMVGGFANYGQGAYLCAAVFTRALTAAQMAQLADEMTSLTPPDPSTPSIYEE